MDGHRWCSSTPGTLTTERTGVVQWKELEVCLKRDIKELEVCLKRDIKELEGATKADIFGLKRDLKELEHRLTARLYRALLIQTFALAGLVAALVKIL